MDRITVIWFVSLVAAVILHEISHGVVALFFGDDTAKRAGRLTLNPGPHIDPFGSIIIPALGALSGLPVIGWAKPVPVNPAALRNPRRHMLYVSLAGPATNFLLAAISAIAARSFFSAFDEGLFRGWDELSIPVLFLFTFAVVNMFLGIFNLLPIPPLDGSALIERVLPARALPGWHRFRPYGFLILFVLVFSTGLVRFAVDPFYERIAEYVLDVQFI